MFKRALTLGMTATLGARHLHAQTADPAAWRAFLEVLERQPMTPDEEALCERAALRTFKAFEFGLVGGGGLNAAAAQEERILVPL